jgi:hypothetical protein
VGERFAANWRALIGRSQQALAPAGPPRGTGELTTWELFVSSRWQLHRFARWNDVIAERHNRASLAILPIVLAVLGWRLGAVSARALYARALLWWAFACAVVTTLRGGGHTFRMAYNWPEAIAIWLPVALFAAAAVATIVAADATRGERLRPAHREPAGADPRTRSWVGAWVLGLGGLGARGSAARQIARSPDRSTDLQI